MEGLSQPVDPGVNGHEGYERPGLRVSTTEELMAAEYRKFAEQYAGSGWERRYSEDELTLDDGDGGLHYPEDYR